MSLSDRYNRGDGRIQSFDRYLTHLGDRTGEYWWNQTGIHRSILTQSLYVISAWAATQHFMVTHNPIVLAIASVALLSYMGAGQSKGGLVEQIQAEAAGLPKNTLAFMRLEILGLGVFQLAIAVGSILAYFPSDALFSQAVGEPLLLGLALSALQFSDYIRRTNPATPSNGMRAGPRRSSAR